MINFKLQPFEKNNYFYGKLLTVRDFQIEQKYNDEKRWMINRLMFGSGVATGLKVIMIDEHTITIEPGVAIDNLGREIVIASPMTQKLSLIDGFDNSGYAKSVYLCLDYEEKEKERIQSISNSLDEEDDKISSYNRIQENYKLELKEDISKEDLNRSNSALCNKTCIYENEQVQVFQTTPKYVEPNEEFDVDIEIIKKDTVCKLEFSYSIQSEQASSSCEINDKLTVSFKEPSTNVQSYYKLRYKMKASNIKFANSMLTVCINNVKIDDNFIYNLNNIYIKFNIVDNKIGAIFRDYNSKSFENIVNDESYESIYLAKIDLLKVGATYMIKSVNNVPFNQYVYNTNIIVDLIKERLDKIRDKEEKLLDNSNITNSSENKTDTYLADTWDEPLTVKTGEYIFKYDYNQKYPNIKYSNEIVHGLGQGDVYINTAIVAEENFDDVLISGDVDIFDKNKCKIATTVNIKRGTFVIAVKAENSFPNKQLRIKWQAIKVNK